MCVPFKLVNHPRFASFLIGSILGSKNFILITGSIIGSITLNNLILKDISLVSVRA